MQRLFVGLALPEQIGFRLGLLRGGIAGARWVEPRDFHITLRFIGDISPAAARELADNLDLIGAEPVDIQLTGLDWFGGEKPRLVYVKLGLNPGLERLQAAIEKACRNTGLAPVSQRFLPHITLARFNRADFREVQDFVAGHNLIDTAAFTVTGFCLFSARPGRGGGPYHIEQHYPLNQAAYPA